MPLLFMVGVCLLLVVVAVASFRWGVRMAAEKDVRSGLRPLRLTKTDALLYRKAAGILNRLINVTDLEGDLAADIVSTKTREQIEGWLSQYKKELDNVL